MLTTKLTEAKIGSVGRGAIFHDGYAGRQNRKGITQVICVSWYQRGLLKRFIDLIVFCCTSGWLTSPLPASAPWNDLLLVNSIIENTKNDSFRRWSSTQELAKPWLDLRMRCSAELEKAIRQVDKMDKSEQDVKVLINRQLQFTTETILMCYQGDCSMCAKYSLCCDPSANRPWPKLFVPKFAR